MDSAQEAPLQLSGCGHRQFLDPMNPAWTPVFTCQVNTGALIIMPPGGTSWGRGRPARGPEARAPRKLAGVMIKANAGMAHVYLSFAFFAFIGG